MRAYGLAAGLAALAVCGAAQAAPPDLTTWRQLDPANTLYIDTTKGRIVVEMYPEVAPNHVARIKQLAHEHFYDGLTFHRVVDKMMAQGGDPLGTGVGGSSYPDLQAEFRFRRGGDMPFVVANAPGGSLNGFYKNLPIATQPNDIMLITKDAKADAWGLHCPGVASMAREEGEDTANSQFFLMREAYPSLDKRYTIWGRVVWGEDVVKSLAVGDPPPSPDKMTQVRVAADMPAAERAPLYVMRTDSKAFEDILDQTKKDRGANFSVCDVDIPARVSGEAKTAEKEKDKPWWRKIPLIP
ncbi:MAG TPA: peptidylprolyl isomerase [Caulobacterales bacterium]|jgi:peptidylprolyl isomerase|nr:peptidylprolyl isomerase [Caulobacterales bacterium]